MRTFVFQTKVLTMTDPQPLCPQHVPEVPLPSAPLAAVVAQVRFPPILAIGQPDALGAMARFQECLRSTYPHLAEHHTHHIDMTETSHADVRRSLVWRLSDNGDQSPIWRVSLAQDFVALETREYNSRTDFLARLKTVIDAVATCFHPVNATRLGLRYVDRLSGTAETKISDMVRPEVLGIIAGTKNTLRHLQSSLVHTMMHAHFLAPDDDMVLARWGILPPNTTHDPNLIDPIGIKSWILDMDMSTTREHPFVASTLVNTATSFAKCLYWLFREMVTDEFLRHHGGKL